MNVTVSENFNRFVADLVASGAYRSQREVVQEALRLLQMREALRQDIQKGVEDAVAGRVTRLATKKEIGTFFSDIKHRGRKRHTSRNASHE